MQQLAQLLQQNEQLERKAVLDLDAIIHKVTQEVSEVLELVHETKHVDLPHLIDEIGDVLLNVLSVQYRLEQAFTTFTTAEVSTVSPLDIAISLGKRNDLVQKHRGIYARRTVPLNEVTQQAQLITGQLLKLAELHAGQKFTLEELCKPTLQKFIDRAEAYGPHIDLKEHIRNIPDYPEPGVQFKDITTLLHHPRAYKYTIQELYERIRHQEVDVIVGLDARGFFFSGPVSEKLGKPMVPIRKKGKLPYTTLEDSYLKEYGGVEVQTMHIDAIQKGQKVIIIDDLLATAGTALSAARLIEQAGGIVVGIYFVIGLDVPGKDGITGREKIKGYKVETLVDY